MPFAREPFLLRRGDRTAADEGRRAVMIEG
jgi:hypothetical protein